MRNFSVFVLSFLSVFAALADGGKKVSELDDFLSSGVFCKPPQDGGFRFHAFTGSKSLVDEIAIGLEKFGKIEISYTFDEEDGSYFKRKSGMILDTVETPEKITTVVATGYVEFTFEMLRFHNAFSLELKSMKNVWSEPIRLSEISFNQISPFSCPDLPDESERLTGKAQRGALFAEDGRYMGVVSSAAALEEIGYGLDAEKNAVVNARARFAPVGKNEFLKPGEDCRFKGIWACYLVGGDSRDGWRQRTNMLHIFPKGRKSDILSARRKIVGQIGGRNVIRGSIDLDISKAKKIKDEEIKSRLCPQVASEVYELDVSHVDLSSWRMLDKEFSLLSRPGRMNWASLVPQIYVDSSPLPLSCWPNEDWAVIAEFGNAGVFDGSSMFDSSEKEIPSDGSKFPWFYYSGDRPSRWLKAEEILLSGFWAYDWHNSAVMAQSIDAEKKTISLRNNVSFGVRSGNSKARRWRAYNLIEEIDLPGEYAIDRKTKKIYFLPPGNVSDIKRISISVGTNALYLCDGMKDTEFRNIVFEEAQSAGVVLKNCENVVFKNCVFRNMLRDGLSIENSSRDCSAEDCVFENFRYGAVFLNGGKKSTLTNGGNEIRSSTIRNTNLGVVKSGSAIKLYGVGNAVRNCGIYNTPAIAVYFRGCNLALDGCSVSNACYLVDDSGACYQGRNCSNRGNVLKNNVFADIGTEFQHGNAAVYFDDGDCGNIVYSNVFTKCGFPGNGNFGTVFSHGGFDNFVTRCKFVDCIRPFGSAPWSKEKWEYFFKEHSYSLDRDMENMKVPFAAYYPSIEKFKTENNVKSRNYAQYCEVEGSPLFRETKIKGELFPGILCGNWQTNMVNATRPCLWTEAFGKMPRSKSRR